MTKQIILFIVMLLICILGFAENAQEKIELPIDEAIVAIRPIFPSAVRDSAIDKDSHRNLENDVDRFDD